MRRFSHRCMSLHSRRSIGRSSNAKGEDAMDESRLQMLLDKAEIRDVQLRYATGLDTRNWALFQSCFTDEFDADLTCVRRGGATRVSGAMGRIGAAIVEGPCRHP